MTETFRFRALEHHADGSFAASRWSFAGGEDEGWEIRREDRPWLQLGPGYRALRVAACGVCSTDLDRRFLPFPLPQIIGHEVLIRDGEGRRQVVEINASHRARGVEHDCPECRDGLDRHCPDRLVLGIHDLPGGFGPLLLAPVGGVLPVPDLLSDEVAVLTEPLAAALRAVEQLELREGDEVAVLGPRKLGMLVLALLAARRRREGIDYRISAIVRRPELGEVATRVGADRVLSVDSLDDREPSLDLVVDCSGSPEAFELALAIARREVHLKSTHGRPAAGFAQVTQFVVDELSIERHAGQELASEAAGVRPSAVVIDDLAEADRLIQPGAAGAIRPTGCLLLRGPGAGTPVERAVFERGLRLSSSRCGDFARALQWMEADETLRGIGELLVTHRFGIDDLPRAFEVARGPDCIKAVVGHGLAGGGE